MHLRDWFLAKGLSTTDADAYATSFLGGGITDDEQDLPEVGLTREDLKDLGVKVGHRHRMLEAIRAIGQPVLVRDASEEGEARHDLIKRFLPIALSVGFAARLVDIPWIKDNKQFDYGQAEQIARLLAGVFVVVSGWEWYHRDLRWHPLNNPGRFFVDVVVVITTIVFLYSAKNEGLWLGSLAFIFFLYLCWDGLSIKDYPGDYYPSISPLAFQPLRGVITNVLWFIYFLALAILTLVFFSSNSYQTFISCFFVFVGALSLRLLGKKPERMSGSQLAWAALVRTGLIVGLLALYSAVSIYLPGYITALMA
jgi:hypothetical protein